VVSKWPQTETGDRGPAGDWVLVFSENTKCHDSEPDEDGSGEVSCEEKQNSKGDDDVEEVEGSGSRASTKPILRLPERNDEDTSWTRANGTKPVSGKNKLTVEDMGRVRKRKEFMRSEVTKNEVVDRWLRDQVKPERWNHITTAFPHGDKYSPQQ
jgi:hypothetical protein